MYGNYQEREEKNGSFILLGGWLATSLWGPPIPFLKNLVSLFSRKPKVVITFLKGQLRSTSFSLIYYTNSLIFSNCHTFWEGAHFLMNCAGCLLFRKSPSTPLGDGCGRLLFRREPCTPPREVMACYMEV